MFKGLFKGVSLARLNINGFKNLRVIESGAFMHLSHTLEYLDLSENSIETIEPGAIKCLSKLKEFNVVGNRLTDVQLDNLQIELPYIHPLADFNCFSSSLRSHI
jgi:Leucine-rich repeat (LRR) protein